MKITQILFYSGTLWIAWYTYRQAKKTLFNPMKNEVFKKQIILLKEFEQVFWRFNNENLLYEELKLYDTLHYNASIVRLKNLYPGEDPELYIWQIYGNKFSSLIPVESDSIYHLLVVNYFEKSDYDKFYVHANLISLWKMIYAVSYSIFIPKSIQHKAISFINEISIAINDIQNIIIVNESLIIDEQTNNVDLINQIDNRSDCIFRAYQDLINEIRNYTHTDNLMDMIS